MNDIETREDILLVMHTFYTYLLNDQSINFFFTKATDVDQHLEKHFQILADFWEQGLFLKGGYSNNMFQIHKDIHDKILLHKSTMKFGLIIFIALLMQILKEKMLI